MGIFQKIDTLLGTNEDMQIWGEIFDETDRYRNMMLVGILLTDLNYGILLAANIET